MNIIHRKAEINMIKLMQSTNRVKAKN